MRKLLTLFFIAVFFLGFSQNSYRFRNYTLTNGLSQSVVTSIIQDEVGTLWIGTQDGLNRFDGQSFENFTSDNTKGISNEYIHTSILGKNNMLWFGSSNGLICYDSHLEKFSNYSVENNSALQIQSLAEDKNGNIWIASASNGIFMFDIKTKKITSKKNQIPSKKINFIEFADDNYLFVGTEDRGLFKINSKTGDTRTIQITAKKPGSLIVNAMKRISAKKWLLATNQGLFQLNEENHKVQAFLPELDQMYGMVSISDVIIESENSYFLATETQGLLTVSFQNGNVHIYSNNYDALQQNSLLNNSINVLFKDKSGVFWVGTNRGLGSFDPINIGFIGIGPAADQSNGIQASNVWSFAEDPNHKYIFIGTDNAVSQYDQKTGKFRHFFKNRKGYNEREILETSILSMHVINENELIVGTTDGLYKLQITPTDYLYTKIDYQKVSNPSNFDRIYRIAWWKEKKYFLATRGGVILYDEAENSFRVFENDPQNPKNTITPGVCRVAYKDNKGQMWFATSAGGLNVLQELNGKIEIVPAALNPLILKATKDYITNINQISEDVYWLGTMGSGIVKLNVKEKKTWVYNKRRGLPNNVIYGILVDKSGTLWISTNKGISKFNPATRLIQNYSEVDGLMSNEFNQGAYLQASNGYFYFGGIYGFNYFNPKNLYNVSKNVDVRILKFKLDGDWIHPGESDFLKQSISNTDAIELGYKQRSFTIKIMPTDLSNPQLIEYKYVLEGSDEGEIFIGNFNQIHFTLLQPGNYTLKVYARLANDVWSIHPASLKIKVAAPFWQSVWFWVAFAIIIGILVLIYIRKRIDNERREQVRLEMKIAERTSEIREQNTEIEKQKRTIVTKNNLLQRQKNLLEVEKEKTEKFLKNIIPESTYEELKTKGRASARAYTTVSVMFTDFVGFTKSAQKMNATELVNELDIYFRKFDEIIVLNNLEKIKTMGDAYMCAGGVPVKNNTNPIDTCLAALQIQESMRIMQKEAKESGRIVWDLRLGINTGEVTAGVIGSEKLAYDIWGSTVNEAHRMEMLGEPGKVTISGNTFKFIEPYFLCTFRGKVKSKSKELIDMYTVDRIKPELSVNGEGLYPNEKFKEIVNLHFYSTINYYKAERHIIRVLEKQLSPKLHYHSIAHTKDVCDAIERLALSEGITDEALFLLKSAATYHDAGFVEQYEHNEPIGARMAEEILPDYGYSPQHIEQIKELIFVTQIPHKPKNNLEEIMCDADLDYLGREDFHEIADRLRLELREHGKIDSDRAWDEIQVKFLTLHKYFTKTAKDMRDEKKAQNLKEIKERLKRDEYND
ncbi:MAG: adenylate/guanylate cyclase domain-containing protein [Crocinitomicaceae bacterium]|nr:adenylate/guanylate cyclase domain-containing protein [Crocinitomicaceae bacterium]